MNPSDPRRLSRTVSVDEEGSRIDKILSTWPEIGSRGKAARLIEAGAVFLNGKTAKPSVVPKAGDLIEALIPDPVSSDLIPYDIPLEIIHEDSDLLVVNKPSGLVVHPAAGHAHDTLVNALISKTDGLSMGFGEDRPGIVHRLDKETSGLLVIAKNDSAQDSLVRQFQARTVHRIYQAVIFGEMRPTVGTIRSFLARHPTDRKRFASLLGSDGKIRRDPEPAPNSGKWAVTNHRTIAKSRGLSFVELKLETGRTHQIRVHLSEVGHPLVGDRLYGSDRRLRSLESPALRERISGLNRFLLHARELGFVHPKTGETMRFERNWPEQEIRLLEEWGFQP